MDSLIKLPKIIVKKLKSLVNIHLIDSNLFKSLSNLEELHLFNVIEERNIIPNQVGLIKNIFHLITQILLQLIIKLENVHFY